MLKQRLVELLAQAANEAQQQGKLPAVTLPDIAIEHIVAFGNFPRHSLLGTDNSRRFECTNQ